MAHLELDGVLFNRFIGCFSFGSYSFLSVVTGDLQQICGDLTVPAGRQLEMLGFPYSSSVLLKNF